MLRLCLITVDLDQVYMECTPKLKLPMLCSSFIWGGQGYLHSRACMPQYHFKESVCMCVWWLGGGIIKVELWGFSLIHQSHKYMLMSSVQGGRGESKVDYHEMV